MKNSKKFLAVLLVMTTIISMVSFMSFAANYSTSYGSFTQPNSSDYAYWNGSKVVKASGTTTSKIKWMQASLNYCIKYKGLNASYLDVDGSFGPASKNTTKAFQSKYGLSVDGSFGPNTISKMKSVLNQSSNSTAKKTTYLSVYNGIHTIPSTCYVSRNGGTMTLNISSSSGWSVSTSGNWISSKVSGNTVKISFNRTFSNYERSASFTIKNNDGQSQKITICQLGIPKETSKHTHSTKYIMLFTISETADMVFTSVKICTTCGYVFNETANSWSPPLDDSMIR